MGRRLRRPRRRIQTMDAMFTSGKFIYEDKKLELSKWKELIDEYEKTDKSVDKDSFYYIREYQKMVDRYIKMMKDIK